ncbi:uncharacterized protein VTP21DRAFT_2026 [Calcarisporiella thermophila]|uniref:uncharacterized protein n=1 Tax=Calcarisporiella thermophila TaxID=911321 RepID=UPI0037445267
MSDTQSSDNKSSRPHPSIACLRCHQKKARCDFLKPACSRCSLVGVPCAYPPLSSQPEDPPLEILGTHVEQIKERIEKMQSDLRAIGQLGRPRPTSNSVLQQSVVNDLSRPLYDSAVIPSRRLPGSDINWKLSLSPSGIRIDTNIASVNDLYKLLLQGLNQLSIQRENQFFDVLQDSFPPTQSPSVASASTPSAASPRGAFGLFNQGQQRLWGHTAIPENVQTMVELPQETLNKFVETYLECFNHHQLVNKPGFLEKYRRQEVDELLINSIYAWSAKHCALFHYHDDSLDPHLIGELYFSRARQLLKKRFDASDQNTILALVNLHLYQAFEPNLIQARLYAGLAARMAQDLKLHKAETSVGLDRADQEAAHRVWWSAYLLDTMVALETGRPAMIDDKDCDVDAVTPLAHEDGLTKEKVDFLRNQIQLVRIRKSISRQLLSDRTRQTLLSVVSKFEKALNAWFDALPPDLQIPLGTEVKPIAGHEFRWAKAIALNANYQSVWIHLHSLFLPKTKEALTPISLLSLNICTNAANHITTLFSTLARGKGWCSITLFQKSLELAVKIHQQAITLSDESSIQTTARNNLVLILQLLRNSPLIGIRWCDLILYGTEAFMDRIGMSEESAAHHSTSDDEQTKPTRWREPESRASDGGGGDDVGGGGGGGSSNGGGGSGDIPGDTSALQRPSGAQPMLPGQPIFSAGQLQLQSLKENDIYQDMTPEFYAARSLQNALHPMISSLPYQPLGEFRSTDLNNMEYFASLDTQRLSDDAYLQSSLGAVSGGVLSGIFESQGNGGAASFSSTTSFPISTPEQLGSSMPRFRQHLQSTRFEPQPPPPTRPLHPQQPPPLQSLQPLQQPQQQPIPVPKRKISQPSQPLNYSSTPISYLSYPPAPSSSYAPYPLFTPESASPLSYSTSSSDAYFNPSPSAMLAQPGGFESFSETSELSGIMGGGQPPQEYQAPTNPVTSAAGAKKRSRPSSQW